MLTKITSKQYRKKRLPRIRARIKGTFDKPRISVLKSNRSITIQCIDDKAGNILFTFHEAGKNIESAVHMGKRTVDEMKKRKIETVVFDRSGYRYHGVIAAFVDTLREGGLQV